MLNMTPEEELVDEQQEIQRAAQLEAARVIQYEEIFSRTNPKPREPYLEEWEEPIFIEPKFMDTFGFKGIAMTISVIGSMLVSAFTVGLMLYISALNTDAKIAADAASPFLQWFSNNVPMLFFIGGLVSVEGYAFSHGLAEGEKSGEVEFSPWALLAVFSIMITTGLLRALGLTSYTEENILYRLLQGGVVLSTGLGIPVLIYYGSKNIGVYRNQHKLERQEAFSKFTNERDEKYREYLASRNQAEETYRKLLSKWYEALEDDYRKKGRALLFGEDTFTVKRNRGGSDNNRQSQKADTSIQPKVQEWLEVNNISPHMIGTKEGDVMSPADVTIAVDQAYNLGLVEYNEDGSARKTNSAPVRKALERLRKTMN